MRAMDYISSANLCFLACDALSLLDKRPIEHGKRVAYILLKLLSAKRDMDEYEIAEYVFLAMIHDIGAYKTVKLGESETLNYDSGNDTETAPHSIYGGLFLESTSPFGERGEILMYHHWPYNQMRHMNFKYERIAMYLHLAEDVEAAYQKEGIKMDVQSFQKKAGQEYIADSVMNLLKCVRRDDMLIHIRDGKHEKELEDYLKDNILFTNEEKDGLMRFVAHIYSLRERARSMEAFMCTIITDEICDEMDMITKDREKIAYAALMRDLGMLSVDIKLINAQRKLTDDEMEEVKDHVPVTEEILSKYFVIKDVTNIACAHHEALNGQGYPKKLHEFKMTKSMFILQVADTVTAMLSPRKYRKEYDKAAIMDVMIKQASRKRYSDKVVKALQARFDNIEKRIAEDNKEFMEMHSRINNKYKLLLETNMGRNIG